MPASSAVTVAPARRVEGRLRVPGDKSIAHRYALLAALAKGRSEFKNFAPGADCRSTLACLRQLGVQVSESGGVITIAGRGMGGLDPSAAPLDAENSGTTMRLLAGVLAGHRFPSRLVGDQSLSRRPMRRVIEPLELMGARVEAVDGHPPLTIHGTALHGIDYRQSVASAQVKSAVLLAGLLADGATSVAEPTLTRDHTERALAVFGGMVARDGLIVRVGGSQRLIGQSLAVPGDFSSAAFWLVAAAALPDSSIEIEDVGLNPTRTSLLDVLRRFGARVEVEATSGEGGEPRGIVRVQHNGIGALDISPAQVPALIDELPAIAALAAYGGTITVSGAAELRLKESDRIAVLVTGFRALGIPADERPDGFIVGGAGPRSTPAGGIADAHGDHRMAMAFTIAALAASGPSTIKGADAVVISYPSFFETLGRLVR
jgi:3-phosphoshikimate 1-carboxyvinyltransferase